MDWGELYATLIRNTGWTVLQCDEQPYFDVLDVLRDIELMPPDYVLLAAERGILRKATAQTEVSQKDQSQIAQLLGGPVSSGIPEDIQNLIHWSNDFGKKPKE